MGDNEKNVLNMIRAEAVNRARTEGATRAMVKDVAHQFNIIHQSDAQKYDKMAQAINVLSVRLEVAIDLLIDPKPLESEGLAVNKRTKFAALCQRKDDLNEKERASK